MNHRSRGLIGALLVVVPMCVSGQALPSSADALTAAKRRSSPLTFDGQPDLQGIWTNTTITPLQRPEELAGKAVFSEREAAEYEERLHQRLLENNRTGVGNPEVDLLEKRKVVPSRRTSLIVDPPDGRIPSLTPEARKRAADRAEARRLHPADGPESRSLFERCLLLSFPFSTNAGPPMLPNIGSDNYYQILQTPGYVVIVVETIHDVRIIPLTDEPTRPQNIRQWLGLSRGRWEGDTLVVDTTNFTNKTNFAGSADHLHVIERFRRVDENTLLYEFTVDDPTTFVTAWTAHVPMRKAEGPLLEYACHEGNYAMEGILAGARAEEKRAAKKAAK